MDTTRRLGLIALGAGAAAILVTPLAGTFDEAAFGAMLRLSGRFSFMLWLATFIAAPLLDAWRAPIAKDLVKYRRDLGLMFAGSHLLHALIIVTYAVRVPEAEFPLYVVIGGGLGLVFIAAMAITSFETPARALGTTRWRRLHTTGTWYISMIFALDFVLTPILQNRALEINYLPWSVLMIAAYGLRGLRAVRRLRPVPARTQR